MIKIVLLEIWCCAPDENDQNEKKYSWFNHGLLLSLLFDFVYLRWHSMLSCLFLITLLLSCMDL